MPRKKSKNSGRVKRAFESRTFSSLKPLKSKSNFKVKAEKLLKKASEPKKKMIIKQMKKLKRKLKREEKMRVSGRVLTLLAERIGKEVGTGEEEDSQVRVYQAPKWHWESREH